MNLIFFHFFILIIKSLSLTMYFVIKLNCLDDWADYINSTEGIIYPNNPSPIKRKRGSNNYIFEYNLIKHNIEKELCIKIINPLENGEFAIDSFFINEYDFSNVKYENFFSCINCNENGIKGFYTTNDKCFGKNYIIKHNSSPRDSFFCLNPTKDPSIFYIDNTKINQKYYKGNTFKYIINNETEKIYIDKIFNINGQKDLEFNLEAVSLVVNKKGNIFNDNEELYINSFFNPKNKYLIHKRMDDEGYLMNISIATKPLNQKNINIFTGEENAN